MPDYVETTTLALIASRDPTEVPAGSWVEITRAEFDAASVILQQYRKWTGVAVEEMTVAEKAAVDAALEEARKDGAVDVLDVTPTRLEIALALVMMDEINILRAQHSLAPRTVAQLKAAIRAKL